MSIGALLEWMVFIALAVVAVGAAAMMIITMSMYRAGLFLMTSFVALAGLLFLLDAELLGVMQIMMNVGGMLVMILFMVMLMMDPGGEMMWDMKRQMGMRGLGAFSMSMPRRKAPSGEAADEAIAHHKMMVDMAMSTEQLPLALIVGPLIGLALALLVALTRWPRSAAEPPPEASAAVGELLLSRYMIAFEGAAMLILAGIAGAVILGRREQHGLQPQETTEMAQPETKQGTWTCPMHPEVRSDKPGKCPKCGMDLVPAGSTKKPGGEKPAR